jgi:thiamine pyrophosphate-dependent acetolactate synthase large subunit-like protein
MNLGTLVTIGAVAPKNFTHIVAHNGSYEANGGHPIPNKQTDFAGVARSSGIAKAQRIDTLAGFEAAIPSLLKDEGPLFVDLIVEQGELGPRSYKDMYSRVRRQAFREALQAG